MSDLVEWLTKILDEDEKAAKRAGGSITEMQNDNYGQLLVPSSWVLADIAAKRAIIAQHTPDSALCFWTNEGWRTHDDEVCDTLRLLASAYADRPGYDESWRP